MIPKSERFELRLEPQMIHELDEWRGNQKALPSRAEAIRQLATIGLETSTTRQLYISTKFQILAAAINPGTKDRLDAGYVYAWQNDVYPMSDEITEWHVPFASSFTTGKEMMIELSSFLDTCWLDKKVPSFYQVEDIFHVRSGQTAWTRSSLIRACRYMFLKGLFDEGFWKTLLSPTKHPVEAQGITRPFNKDEDVWLM